MPEPFSAASVILVAMATGPLPADLLKQVGEYRAVSASVAEQLAAIRCRGKAEVLNHQR
jgi:hypothetical protein